MVKEPKKKNSSLQSSWVGKLKSDGCILGRKILQINWLRKEQAQRKKYNNNNIHTE